MVMIVFRPPGHACSSSVCSLAKAHEQPWPGHIPREQGRGGRSAPAR